MTVDDAPASPSNSGNEIPRAATEGSLEHWDQADPRFAALPDAYVRGKDRSEVTARVHATRGRFRSVEVMLPRGQTSDTLGRFAAGSKAARERPQPKET